MAEKPDSIKHSSKKTEKRIAWLSIGISLTAVILSQFPPIHEYFQRPHLKLTVDEHLFLGQSYGYSYLQWFLQMKNMGKAPGVVNKVEVYMVSGSSSTVVNSLQAYAYLRPPEVQGTPVTPIPFGDILLRPNETWGNILLFQMRWPKADEDRIRKFCAMWSFGERGELASTIQLALQNLERWIQAGHYEILLVVQKEGARTPMAVKAFDLEITDEDVTYLRIQIEHMEDTLNLKQRVQGLTMQLYPREISDSKKVHELLKSVGLQQK